MIISYFIKK